VKDLTSVVRPTEHEFMCRQCTAFVRSRRRLHKPGHFTAWLKSVERWLETHTCGRDRGDGVRDKRRFSHAAIDQSEQKTLDKVGTTL